jgi:hypothetical protein
LYIDQYIKQKKEKWERDSGDHIMEYMEVRYAQQSMLAITKKESETHEDEEEERRKEKNLTVKSKSKTITLGR